MIGVIQYSQFLEARGRTKQGVMSYSSMTSLPLRNSKIKEPQIKNYQTLKPLLQQPIRYLRIGVV